VADKGLTPDLIKQKLGSAISLVAGGGDYLAAALDASTEYFSHTGTQTVARVTVQHAFAAMQDEVWKAHLASYR